MKTALITGATGQDGSYLAELLLSMDYRVYGMMRRSSTDHLERLREAGVTHHPMFELIEGDITDPTGVNQLIRTLRPDEVYNLAAQSHVGSSFSQPSYTFNADAIGPLNMLEAIRQLSPETRFYQASTSELFGDTEEFPQNEVTRFHPASPYAVAKLAAHHFVDLYRRAYSLYACCGILFNHESPRRGENFVTRKITRYVARRIKATQDGHLLQKLKLGNLAARRDWGFAGDYVRAMWMMLQQKHAEDFVIATGQTRTIREFLVEAFGVVGLDWQDHVEVDPSCLRPADVNLLCGNASKARIKLDWHPQVGFKELVYRMVEHDLRLEGVGAECLVC